MWLHQNMVSSGGGFQADFTTVTRPAVGLAPPLRVPSHCVAPGTGTSIPHQAKYILLALRNGLPRIGPGGKGW